ncbi:hypothetical protein WJX77_008711 [Trebouxia sp. C0004]
MTRCTVDTAAASPHVGQSDQKRSHEGNDNGTGKTQKRSKGGKACASYPGWALQYEGRTLSAGHLGLDGLPAGMPANTSIQLGALPQDSRVAISGSLRGAADPEARALPKYSTT